MNNILKKKNNNNNNIKITKIKTQKQYPNDIIKSICNYILEKLENI